MTILLSLHMGIINNVYKKMALEYHPDKIPGPEFYDSTNYLMAIINKIRNILNKYIEIQR